MKTIKHILLAFCVASTAMVGAGQGDMKTDVQEVLDVQTVQDVQKVQTVQEVQEGAEVRTIDEVEESAKIGADDMVVPDNYPRICRRFATLVSAKHLLQKPFDQNISAQAWTNYLRILDYDRSYFTQEDIDAFEKYRLRMSSDLLAGNLEFALAAYKVSKARHAERLEFVKAMLDTNSASKIDFTIAEDFEWKRKDAPWCRDRAEQDELWRKRVKNEVLSRLIEKDYAAAVAAAQPTQTNAQCTVHNAQCGDTTNSTSTATSSTSSTNHVQLSTFNSSTNIASSADAEIDLSPEATVLRHYTQSNFIVQDADAESVIQSYLNAFSMAYDPHTAYMAPAAADDFNIDMNLTLAGIGATLQPEDGAAKVVKIIPGSPCARDEREIRLMKNDKIIGVGQGDGEIEDVTHLPLSKIVKRIRGPKGSKVVLRVISAPGHPSGLDTRLVDIIRDEIKLEEQAATGRVIRVSERAFGYVHLPSFYGSGTSDMRDPKFRSCTVDIMNIVSRINPEIEGLVLDLRGNGGGSLREAITLAGSFIRMGPVVIVREIGNTYALPDRDPAVGFRKPLVVHVDRLSASASEIVAAALQDYGRAVIIGDHTTHGKGTVQTVMPLLAADDSYGSIRLTCATFHRINGGSTQLRGITPDIVIPSTRDGLDIGEDKLPNAVPWSQVPPAQYRQVYPIGPILAEVRSNALERLAADAEYQQHLRVVEHVREINERTSVPLLYKERYDMYAAERKLYEDEGLDDIDEEDGSLNAASEDEEEEPDDGIGKDIVLRASLDVLADLVDRQGQTGIRVQPDTDPSDWLLNLFK